MAIVYDQAMYDAAYSYLVQQWGRPLGTPAVLIHYHRHAIQPALNALYTRARANVPGFASVKNVAIVGGGFGWAADFLRTFGVNVVAIDTSSFVHSVKGTTEESELRACISKVGLDPETATMTGPNGAQVNILAYLMGDQATTGKRTSATVVNESLSTPTSRKAVQKLFPAPIDCIATEDVLSSLTDAENSAFLANVDALRPSGSCVVVHVITTGEPDGSIWNMKTAADWRAFLDGLGYAHHRIFATNE